VTNVVNFTGLTILDIPPDKVLESAKEKLEQVIIVGVMKDTGELYVASNHSEVSTNYFNLELAQQFLLEISQD
jgi:hypothetical protein